MKDTNPTDVAISQELLDEAVRRIVQAVRPLRIILFGSAARGCLGPHSDLDFLLIMPDGSHRRRTAAKAFRALRGIGVPKDVIVATERDVMNHRDNPSLVIKPALDEGRELYAVGE